MKDIVEKIQFSKSDCALFFYKNEILVEKKSDNFILSLDPIFSVERADCAFKNVYFLEIFDQKKLYAIELLEQLKINSEFYFLPVRKILENLAKKPGMFKLVCRAKQLLHWNKVSQFCGECGGVNQASNLEVAKICQQCERITYPHYHPAILVLIERDNEILLGRSHHFPKGLYSPLAGFISPSETAEEAAAREVYEEVGVEIKNIRYFASQSWPFPNSFMIGYFSEYASGSICIDTNELEDARWFNAKNLPSLTPSKASISGQLIDDFLSRN